MDSSNANGVALNRIEVILTFFADRACVTGNSEIIRKNWLRGQDLHLRLEVMSLSYLEYLGHLA